MQLTINKEAGPPAAPNELARPIRFARYLSLKPFDVSTEAGRAQERYRRATLASGGSALARLVSVLVGFVSVGLTLRFLGPDRYGVFVTITSFNALLGFADFGIGNGLLNLVSDANGREDKEQASQYVASAFYILVALAFAIGITFLATSQLIPWQAVFKLGSFMSVQETASAATVLVACTALNLPLGVVQRVQLAYQEGLQNSLWQIAGNLITIIALPIAVWSKAGLPWLILALLGGPVVASTLNWAWHFSFVRPWLFPVPSRFRFELARKVLSTGIQFVVLQIAVLLMSAADNMVAIQILGPSAVALYAVSQRLFNLAGLVPAMWVQPLWPAYAEALARKDFVWVRRTLLRTVFISGLSAAVISASLVLGQRLVFALWTGHRVQPSLELSLGLACWAILSTCGSAAAMYMNGSNAIGVQVVPALLLGGAALGLKLLFCPVMGPAGIAWGSVAAYAAISVPIQVLIVRRLLREQSVMGKRYVANSY